MIVLDLVREHTILSTVVGSRAYGLAGPDSDLDRRGVYVAPTELFWGLMKPPDSVEGPEPERLSWEVEHFCLLALKANPTVLDVLASGQVERCGTAGAELRALLPAFLSLRAVKTFRKATEQQFLRAQASMAEGGDPKWKQIMHGLRLLLVCEHLVRTGELSIDAAPFRDELLEIKSGARDWESVRTRVIGAQADIELAEANSPLPPMPDRAAVERWLVSVRRRSVEGELT
ncbi:nucleotidyltransferase domain-containing protein [Crossiella sp. SN42]|uniref:nucleotidyltransferase domain-containing protein n=1 Tax=Crossiella sp. SN42 TaxID=2944808 RepID=UPI00207C7FAB|nr:nucleotidyltransferase domain-containing protein [Crossiella sp. SN42]MCO1577063.1 nucleotidyltransferase domain-containing protein [Crossiella sp. SN42]